jgi:hypothetical protein
LLRIRYGNVALQDLTPWGATGAGRYHRPKMADQASTIPLDQQLQEIGAQLAWVRDYL